MQCRSFGNYLYTFPFSSMAGKARISVGPVSSAGGAVVLKHSYTLAIIGRTLRETPVGLQLAVLLFVIIDWGNCWMS